MDLLSTKQASVEMIESVMFDLFISSTGFEERCAVLVDKYTIQAKNKISLVSSKKHLNLFRHKNGKLFSKNDFSFIELSMDSNQPLLKYFEDFIVNNSEKDLDILVDYSGMTKVWYVGLLNFLADLDDFSNKVNVYFCYTPVEEFKAKKNKPIKIVESLNHPLKRKSNGRPTTLIIGLGIEHDRAHFLKELINPDKIILLYPDPAYKSYVEMLFEINKGIIGEVDMRNMINYPLYDLDKTNEILTDLILDQRLKSNIVVASLGQKPFGLLAMLISLHYPDIDILRFKPGNIYTEYKKQTMVDPVIMKASFIGSEE